ncbi:VOC family protein [Ferrimonas aestuarii]|uniref:VOC family protein n=1 Tax=Ferrimonas aestuarii TaxID=2569539 RepID=A0A4U1BQ59_9GAMM|nr:VOC family protein [Ferrimonas aestuarii]TKB54685.1 VOC family protein [Ferrimonas aestuarii]
MAKALGVGGVFFKSSNPKLLGEWYKQHLGMDVGEFGCNFEPAKLPENALTVWCAFDEQTRYFDPSERRYMINLIVDDLDGALAQVEQGGATLVAEVVEESYGRFGWFVDPEGNKIELWQPA